jgi:hypothetical protein
MCYAALIGIAYLSPLLTDGAPIGGDPRDIAGIDRAAAIVDHLPAGSRVYDHWLGWELGFYLGDQPPVSVVWEPTVDRLIGEARSAPGYLIAPANEAPPWLDALHAANFRVQPIAGVPDEFVIVAIDSP